MFSVQGHPASSCQQRCKEEFQPRLLTRLGGSPCSRMVGALRHAFSMAKMPCCCSPTDAALQSVKEVLKLQTASVGWDPPRVSGDWPLHCRCGFGWQILPKAGFRCMHLLWICHLVDTEWCTMREPKSFVLLLFFSNGPIFTFCGFAKQVSIYLCSSFQNLGVFNKQILICTELRLDKIRSVLFCHLASVNKDPNSWALAHMQRTVGKKKGNVMSELQERFSTK